MAPTGPTYFTARAIAAQLTRQGKTTEKTRLFGDHDPAVQAALLARGDPPPGETPVFAYYVSDDWWLLVTTGGLARQNGGDVVRLPFAELKSVAMPDYMPTIRRMMDQGVDYGTAKSSLTDLTVEACDGRRWTLVVEPGAAYFAVAKALWKLGGWAGSERRERTGA